MIDYSAFIVESAVARNESRGAHYREDFENRDDENFLKHTMAYMDEKGDINIFGTTHVNTFDEDGFTFYKNIANEIL